MEGILTTFPQESTELTDPPNQESPRRNPSPKCRKSKTHYHTDIPIRRQNSITKYTPRDKEKENTNSPHHQPTVPPPTPPKCPIKIVPARHSTQRRHTHEIYMTRLARKIPTDPAHPINKNGTYKYKHTPLTEEQKNKKKRRKSSSHRKQ